MLIIFSSSVKEMSGQLSPVCILFDIFSRTCSLIANKGKSEVYFAGVRMEIRRKILESSQLRGKLLSKYLGVPLTAKRLSKEQYKPLIERW